MKITSKVDIIIPCKNEATPLPFVIKDFVKYFPNSEIIVIDSASDDDTLKTIKNLKKIYKNITIIESNSPGKGRAVKLGIGYSKSNYSIIVDGDYTYRAKDAKSLFNFCLKNKASVANGNRLYGSSYKNSESRYLHEFGNKAFNYLIRILFGQSFHDIFSGLKILDMNYKKIFIIFQIIFRLSLKLQ